MLENNTNISTFPYGQGLLRTDCRLLGCGMTDFKQALTVTDRALWRDLGTCLETFVYIPRVVNLGPAAFHEL